jgi:hypothetical protein
MIMHRCNTSLCPLHALNVHNSGFSGQQQYVSGLHQTHFELGNWAGMRKEMNAFKYFLHLRPTADLMSR